MGKVRRLRQKYHMSLKSTSAADSATSTPTVLPVVLALPGKTPTPVTLNNDSNIFKGVNISLADLEQTLVPTPKTSQVCLGDEDGKFSQPNLPTNLSKKEKRLARRAELLRKIDTVQRLKAEAKQKLKKKKKDDVQLTNFKQLIDALPELPALVKEDNKDNKCKASVEREIKKPKKNRSVLPLKQRKKKYLEDIKVFKAILTNDSFKADPLAAISNHVVNTISQSN